MGTATFTGNATNPTNVNGNLRVKQGTVTMSSSYATGGDALTPGAIGLERIINWDINTDDGYILKYDKANNKVLAYYADYDAGADGALIQVANAVDLSAVVSDSKFEGK